MKQRELLEHREHTKQALKRLCDMSDKMNDRIGARFRYNLGQMENITDTLLNEVADQNARIKTLEGELHETRGELEYLTSP